MVQHWVEIKSKNNINNNIIIIIIIIIKKESVILCSVISIKTNFVVFWTKQMGRKNLGFFFFF
jgi:hypothetical protein